MGLDWVQDGLKANKVQRAKIHILTTQALWKWGFFERAEWILKLLPAL